MLRELAVVAVVTMFPMASVLAQNLPAPTGEERFLVGRLCTLGTGGPYAESSYSRFGWAAFDGQGSYKYGSESSFSSADGMAYGRSPGGYGSYRISGNVIYLFDPHGSVEQATVQMRLDDGRISEVKYENDTYALQLCQYE